MSDWHIFKQGRIAPHDEIAKLPSPPRWRDFSVREDHEKRGESYQPSEIEVEMVNTALYLRRPLLITGNPGSGKSSLAYAVARQLNLGKVLWWPVNSRSTLKEGLYDYDALGRLRDLNIEKLRSDLSGQAPSALNEARPDPSPHEQMGRYIRLGPLGTALYGGRKPRVLLIDEIDKSDVDLPNDLLHVLEEGAFDIPELQRLTPETGQPGGQGSDDKLISVDVWPYGVNDSSQMVNIENGHVQCKQFPFVILTSNGERELPPAFQRRCLRLDIKDPEGERLRQIVMAHIVEAVDCSEGRSPETQGSARKILGEVETLVKNFESRRTQDQVLATDQLLNAIYLITRSTTPSVEERERILKVVLRELRQR